LWKKIVKYTYNEATGQYDQEPAQYFRMSGTNGTSINVKGTIDYAYNSSSVFPPPTSSLNGKNAIAKEDNKIWVCQQVQPNQYAWTPSGNIASDGFSYTVVQGNFNGNYQSTSVLTGHLVMWSNAASDWIDLGKFKGENGTTYYTHYAWATNVVFAAGTLPIPAGQTNRPNSTSVTGGSLEPSEDGSKPYMGILIDTKVSASTVYENYTWSYAKGDKGDIGKVGRFFYYAGVWDDIASSDSFEVSDAQAPYFQYGGTSATPNYWVFNPSSNGTYTKGQMGTPSSSSANWEQMTNDFKYIITEALFADFAKLGWFIVSGRWLISQHGTINGQASTNYTAFDTSHPFDDIGTNFIPNFCVDGLTGETYQNDAYIKGTIHATNGEFNGTIKTEMMYSKCQTVDELTTSYTIFESYQGAVANTFKFAPYSGTLVVTLPNAGDYESLELRFLCSVGNTSHIQIKPKTGDSIYYEDFNGGYGWHYTTTGIAVAYDCMVIIQCVSGSWYVIGGKVTTI
jgi:hypothetical protein